MIEKCSITSKVVFISKDESKLSLSAIDKSMAEHSGKFCLGMRIEGVLGTVVALSKSEILEDISRSSAKQEASVIENNKLAEQIDLLVTNKSPFKHPTPAFRRTAGSWKEPVLLSKRPVSPIKEANSPERDDTSSRASRELANENAAPLNDRKVFDVSKNESISSDKKAGFVDLSERREGNNFSFSKSTIREELKSVNTNSSSENKELFVPKDPSNTQKKDGEKSKDKITLKDSLVREEAGKNLLETNIRSSASQSKLLDSFDLTGDINASYEVVNPNKVIEEEIRQLTYKHVTNSQVLGETKRKMGIIKEGVELYAG
eukprot:TRINITY_DN1156_c0_g1_i11.p1 TRINITY_DN1156_c0_g1~~TRINITY_DN1156_c0_g1_i11.p1  ORF type:complete len:318 (-),score=70.44 TRINITY_DN1156_c0_g1_i11:962-1915(-)